MSKKEGYIRKEDRKNILLLCDDIRMHSGIATMAREFVLGTAHKYNWTNLGAAIQHPEIGKMIDISADVDNFSGITDASVFVIPNNGYGDPTTIRQLLSQNNYDAIFIFTDPRYWTWLFEIEREIRSKLPIFWLNIWDNYPAPLYNRDYYDSVDLLMGISKQTKNINKLVLGENAKSKVIEYVPHGINEDTFFPIRPGHELYSKLEDLKKTIIPDDIPEFTVFFNSRNVHRKHPGDTLLAYKLFCDHIGPEKAKKCALIMHTQAIDKNGTDLIAMKNALTDPSYVNIYFSQAKVTPEQMNMLYNMADLTVLLSSNEGWGLSLTESMMAGTMIVGNVTGGMQDQMRFVDENGKWIDFSADFPSNHRGTYKEHGEWAIPVFPTNISVQGSVPTPYIFDDRCSIEDAAEAILQAYNLGAEERDRRGMKGREWVTSDESQMSAANMCKNISQCMEKAFENFKPRTKYDLIKIVPKDKLRVEHNITNY